MSSAAESPGKNWAVWTCCATMVASVLGTRARLVVRREAEEDDEPEEHREAGGEDTEDARGSVTVLEVAALRSTPAHQQHRRDGDGGDDEQDGEAEEDVHAPRPGLATTSHTPFDQTEYVATSLPRAWASLFTRV